MDPPSYGRGPGGEVWKIEDAIFDLLQLCAQLMDEDSVFFLLNSYTTGLQPAAMGYMLASALRDIPESPADGGNERTGSTTPSETPDALSQAGVSFPCAGGFVTSAEIGVPVSASGLILPCGASSRWER